ncbi:hypothetical protein NDU88_005010 [Pleurodeles waltl]|uniref:Uncharacterized protein n=1 Tax=Pleurodeles waltl TaxID=8319 RepID=A0AAV7UHM0_PLEWA|nr:hypothetical protein NDU88_005010 [Pleurodeles waltl]
MFLLAPRQLRIRWPPHREALPRGGTKELYFFLTAASHPANIAWDGIGGLEELPAGVCCRSSAGVRACRPGLTVGLVRAYGVHGPRLFWPAPWISTAGLPSDPTVADLWGLAGGAARAVGPCDCSDCCFWTDLGWLLELRLAARRHLRAGLWCPTSPLLPPALLRGGLKAERASGRAFCPRVALLLDSRLLVRCGCVLLAARLVGCEEYGEG